MSSGEGEERGGGRADDGRLEVDEDRAGHVLAGAGLGEEGVEGVVTAANRLVGGHLAIGLDAVLEAEELPARVAGLDAGLAEVESDALALRTRGGGRSSGARAERDLGRRGARGGRGHAPFYALTV